MTSVKVVDAEVVEESPSSPSSSPSSSPKNTSSYVFEQPKRAPSSPVSFPKNGKAASSFELPSSKLLSRGAATVGGVDSEVLQTEGELLIATLSAYNIEASLFEAVVGPSVVTYMTSLLAGTKLSRVIGLADDLALAFGKKVRVVPSRLGRIGFEVARDVRATVGLRELVEDLKFQSMKASLPIVIGRDVRGEGVFMDLAEAPHMIVAGSTGSGKSVGINTLLVSLLCRRTPDEVKLLLIDPKCVELLPFANLPHLLCPPVTTSSEAQVALSWCVREMERRYKLLASAGAKNITSYNAKTSSSSSLPFIVVVVDEAGDLMMQGGKEVESLLVRLGQKARASGIHIVLATQRPSVDILTGLIKSNFPARIAYRTAQSVDSRIVLDEVGAERLLGRGDALVRINGGDALVRAQGPLVSEEEIEAVVSHWCQQSAPRYDASVLEAAPSEEVKKASSSKATSSPSSRVWS
jgi:S-DNA-T family DNA segregation ATPase FtsK/SpoIIIE